MMDGTALCFFIAFWIFSKGLQAVIQTQPTVVAAVGENAFLKCQLMEMKYVHNITWQKILTNGKRNIASHYKHHGQTVNPVFKDKVEFVESEDAGLQNSSIFINNVTEQDEGCYRCLFHSFTEGTLTGITCLQVYELHPPVLHVRRSDSPEEWVVTCSATGRPAPNVTLRATPQDHNLTHYNSVSVSNTNGTVTVTTTAVLSALHLNSTQVGCTAGVLAGPQIEVLETIPGFKPTSADGSDDESGSDHSDFSFTWILYLVLFVVFCGCAAAFCFMVRRKRRNENRGI